MAEPKKIVYDINIRFPGIERDFGLLAVVAERTLSLFQSAYRLVENGFQTWQTYNHYKIENLKVAHEANLTAVKISNQARYEQLKEEGKLLDVWLTSCGPNKIQVIKAIREITHLGLKEAKDIADRAPHLIWPDAHPELVNEFLKIIQEAGGTAEIRQQQP